MNEMCLPVHNSSVYRHGGRGIWKKCLLSLMMVHTLKVRNYLIRLYFNLGWICDNKIGIIRMLFYQIKFVK
jgi:hypothetical protein